LNFAPNNKVKLSEIVLNSLGHVAGLATNSVRLTTLPHCLANWFDLNSNDAIFDRFYFHVSRRAGFDGV
jgi:hypothetical protein